MSVENGQLVSVSVFAEAHRQQLNSVFSSDIVEGNDKLKQIMPIIYNLLNEMIEYEDIVDEIRCITESIGVGSEKGIPINGDNIGDCEKIVYLFNKMHSIYQYIAAFHYIHKCFGNALDQYKEQMEYVYPKMNDLVDKINIYKESLL